jgi:hypothetical protein
VRADDLSGACDIPSPDQHRHVVALVEVVTHPQRLRRKRRGIRPEEIEPPQEQPGQRGDFRRDKGAVSPKRLFLRDRKVCIQRDRGKHLR